MRKQSPRLILAALAAVFALCYAATTHAATVAQLTCSDVKGESQDSGNLTANLSFYDVGLQNTVSGSEGTGAGAGKVTVQPLHIHTSVVNFEPFFELVTEGTHVSNCKITVKANGNTIVYTFNNLIATSVNAIGRSASSIGQQTTSFLDVMLTYEKIEVQTNGKDDGGTSEPVGWDISQNKAT